MIYRCKFNGGRLTFYMEDSFTTTGGWLYFKKQNNKYLMGKIESDILPGIGGTRY